MVVYLEYHSETKQVVEIHETEPTLTNGYEYGKSNEFALGDEFEQTIWINKVDEYKIVTSYSAIRNNPQAKRLLAENDQLKQENIQIKTDLGNILFESAMDKSKISELEVAQGDLLMEIAMLKMGGSL